MHFDAVVTNNTFHFRANATNLLSSEFLALVKQRLEPGGVYFYNTAGREAHRRPLVRHFPLGLNSSNQNCILIGLLRAVGIRNDEIEMGNLRASSASEFSHSLGQKRAWRD